MVTALNSMANSAGVSQNITEAKTDKEVYKTHTGIKTGAGYAAFSLASMHITNKIIDSFNKDAAVVKGMKRIPKISWTAAAWSIITSLGCGAIADTIINKKREKLASDMKTKDAKTLIKEDKNIQYTPKGNLYYKSNISDKIGPLMGIGVFVVNNAIGLVSRAIKKQPIRLDIWNAVDMLLTGAAGGWILGSIADKCSNKTAVAHADSKTNS